MATASLRTEQANARRVSPPRRLSDQVREGADPIRLVLKTDNGVRLLRLEEMGSLVADGNVVVINTSDGGPLRMRVTLSRLLSDLRGRGFVRVHRGIAVRAAAIVAVEKSRYRKA